MYYLFSMIVINMKNFNINFNVRFITYYLRNKINCVNICLIKKNLINLFSITYLGVSVLITILHIVNSAIYSILKKKLNNKKENYFYSPNYQAKLNKNNIIFLFSYQNN